MKKINKKAFTLIELLVVVLIIGILAAIAVPQYKKAVLKADYQRAKLSASEIEKAYKFYHLQNGKYPAKFSDLDFAQSFDESNTITTGEGYVCSIKNKDVYCKISGNKLGYYINFGTLHTNKITKLCLAFSSNTSDIYNKICQEETGQSISADCGANSCRRYEYAN